MRRNCLLFFFIGLTNYVFSHNDTAIYQSEAFCIYPDRVTQSVFEAKAVSSNKMISNYRSAEANYSPTVQFKFSINCYDNEMPFEKCHAVTIQPQNGQFVTEVEFGKQLISINKKVEEKQLPENTVWTVKLNMRKVLDAFKRDGFYTLFNGNRILKADFKGVYIAGSASPLSWYFTKLYTKSNMKLEDPDGDGIYEVTLILNSKSSLKSTNDKWILSKNLSSLPKYNSDFPISDAIYNLSLEEMLMAIEPDSTFRTGKEWAGVWTRDISYSIILAMAQMQPKVAKYSLIRKVKNDRIIQDTGTGGSYPVSTDRMIWAVAAWELYKVTGDNDWLKYAFKVIQNSIDDDLKNAYSPVTGMMKGESSFLDWREQTYPLWMQPADIYQSENLGTNAVHYEANIVLAKMAEMLYDKKSAKKYNLVAASIKDGINKYLWMQEKGFYGQYLYGRNHLLLSPRDEALGEALCVLFGIADVERAKSIVVNTPVLDYGIPCIYPQIPRIPAYHNNGIWPFVQSYWALASAKAGNEASVMSQIAGIYRSSALFLTNKENLVAETGDFAGTCVNSSVMLWSLSGNLALVHRVLFGIDFQSDKLIFNPFVPKPMAGSRTLSNFKYRNAVLNIEMNGYGDKIRFFVIDGVQSKPEVSANISGEHDIKIVLENNQITGSKINKVSNSFSIDMPEVNFQKDMLSWNTVKDAVSYNVIKNGTFFDSTKRNKYKIKATEFAEYQVIAIDKNNVGSFASEPIIVSDPKNKTIFQIEDFAVTNKHDLKNFNGKGYAEISKTQNRTINIPIKIKQNGIYTLQFRYANGNGPVYSNNKCAIRTLNLNGNYVGTIVLPQRGSDEWSNWGYSNSLKVNLKKGGNIIQLKFEDVNENMDGDVNQAMLDEMLVWKIKI